MSLSLTDLTWCQVAPDLKRRLKRQGAALLAGQGVFGIGPIRASQEVVEVLDAGSDFAKISQEVIEVLDTGTSSARVSQEVVEVLDAGPQFARVSQIVIEVLCFSAFSTPPPLIYPDFTDDVNVDLPVRIDVIRRVVWGTSQGAHVSGRESRVPLQTYPLYEWDLVYDILRDFPVGTIPSELQRLEGFYLTQMGKYSNAPTPTAASVRPGGFLLRDPDDNSVTGQYIATADGIQRFFVLVRTYGDIGYGAAGTEPIGWLNVSQTFNVYIDSVATTDYQLWQGPPFGGAGMQVISFNSTPTSGQVISVDMQYYFFVRFADDGSSFDAFLHKFWLTRKVTLRKVMYGPFLPLNFVPKT